MFNDPFGEDNNSYWIPYADFLAGVAMIFLVVAALMLFHITDPNKKNKTDEIKSPGTVMVEAFWKEDADVDLWVKSPGDIPVGYSRKNGKYFDLLRDDLGRKWEKGGQMHHENAYTRNAPEGEYIVNLHQYSNLSKSSYPIEVEVIVQIVKQVAEPIETQNTPITKIMRTTVPLISEGQQTTVIRFRLDDKSEVIQDSINHDQIPLREATTK